MTRFWRDGHWRSGIYGNHWVEGHWVHRTEWDRFSRPSTVSAPYVFRQRLTFESYANPNATCPKCGARVAFYQSPYGGRVYFDYLGWPWPKHPCTDSSLTRNTPTSGQISTVAPSFRWQLEGWIPVQIEKIVLEEPWHVLRLKTLKDGTLIRALVPEHPGDLVRAPANVSPWSSSHFATLSYLDDRGEARELTVCRYSEFCLLEPSEIVMPRTTI